MTPPKRKGKEETGPATARPKEAPHVAHREAAPPSRSRKAKAPSRADPPKKFTPPELLESIWDREISTAYHALNPRQQLFLVEYIRCNFVGMRAYKASYNPDASDDTAKSCASQLLTNPNLRAILQKFRDSSLEDAFLIRQTLREACSAYKPELVKNSEGKLEVYKELPDFNARIKAASELREFHKDLAGPANPEGGQVPREFTTNFNFFLQQMGMEPVRLPAADVQDAQVVESKPGPMPIEGDFGASFKKFAGA